MLIPKVGMDGGRGEEGGSTPIHISYTGKCCHLGYDFSTVRS